MSKCRPAKPDKEPRKLEPKPKPKKVSISIKLDSGKAEQLKKEAEEKNTSITEIATARLDDYAKTLEMELETKEIHQMKKELQTKYDKAAGKIPKMKKRIQVFLTRPEWNRLDAEAAMLMMTRATLLWRKQHDAKLLQTKLKDVSKPKTRKPAKKRKAKTESKRKTRKPTKRRRKDE